MKSKRCHGGARFGAGRKTIPAIMRKEQVGLKLPVWLIEWLNTQSESRAVLIENALRSVHKIQPPLSVVENGGEQVDRSLAYFEELEPSIPMTPMVCGR